MCEPVLPSYPIRILPRSGWGTNFHGVNITQQTPDAVVGHRLGGDLKQCFYEDPITHTLVIEGQYLQSSRMRNLSTSLLGAAFLPEDFAFEQKENGAADWDTTTDIYLTDFREGIDYRSVTSRFCVVGWTLSELEGKDFPFKRKFESEDDFNIWKASLPEQTTDPNINHYLEAFTKIIPASYPHEEDVRVCIKMIHRPTNLNYWHLTLDIFPFDDYNHEVSAEDVEKDKNIKKHTLRGIAEYLRRNSVIIDSDFNIPKINNWNNIAITNRLTD